MLPIERGTRLKLRMLNYGEIFVVSFITFAILSSTYWLKAGSWLGVRIHRLLKKPRA